MAFFVAIQWSITEGGEDAIDEALGAIKAHVEEKHPAIRSVRLFRQFAGPMPHRGYLWMEEFPSLGSLDNEPDYPECDEVWAPVRALAIPGTFFQSVWTDAGGGGWLTR